MAKPQEKPMSTAQMIGIAIAVLVVLYFLMRSGSGGKAAAPQRGKIGMVHLVPGPDGCCEAAKAQQSARYKAAVAPSVPLPGCSMPLKCKCSMQSLGERRSGRDRRSGVDKREIIRFEEKEPRRKDRGRRTGDHDVFREDED
jgi:hypothetical protein